MKHRLTALFAALMLCITLATQTLAVELPIVIANGEAIQMDAPVSVIQQTTYVSYWPIVKTFYPDATATWENDRAVVRAEGLHMEIQPGAIYMVANGRYLYIPEGVLVDNGILTVPVRTLGQALGLNVEWDASAGAVVLTESGSGPIKDGSLVYQADVVHWLSRIINAESGNQPLLGQVAVGSVIRNRVASPIFPNTVYEVIHQTNQFTPVRNGSINKTPDEDAVIAAKLALEGVKPVGDSLYFINPKVSGRSWVARNRTHVATIAAHAFYK